MKAWRWIGQRAFVLPMLPLIIVGCVACLAWESARAGWNFGEYFIDALFTE